MSFNSYNLIKMLKLSHSVLNTLKTNKNIVRFDKLLKSTMVQELKPSHDKQPRKNVKSNNAMVAAAFASLKPSPLDNDIHTPTTDDKIKRANSVEDLLSISEGSGISRRHALKVVSTLADWSSNGKVKVSDFENDSRFIKLCRILSKGAKINRNIISRNEDLSTVLNVTADEEAARLISDLNLSQMVKVLSSLSMRKRRSVLLLRTLAYNITASNQQLNLKQCADVLYSMCVLSFIDENLLSKICNDIKMDLDKELSKSTVIGSVITSLGLLKYKNEEILDQLSEWIFKNYSICRSQDVFSLFTTLATVNYSPNNSDEIFDYLLKELSLADARKSSVWLNFVWSLIILNRATSEHISSILNNDFIQKISDDSPAAISSKLKLLNINAAANYLLNYEGELLPSTSTLFNVKIQKTKEKTEMVECVVDTLKNLIKEENLKFDTNTNLGFCVDIECSLDNKHNPVPLNEENRSAFRVAILVYDYHDMCIGKVSPTGANILTEKLLNALNFKVLTIPYTEFKTTDKIVNRVRYIEKKLKLVK